MAARVGFSSLKVQKADAGVTHSGSGVGEGEEEDLIEQRKNGKDTASADGGGLEGEGPMTGAPGSLPRVNAKTAAKQRNAAKMMQPSTMLP